MDGWAKKGITMNITRSIRATCVIALLAISAAAFAQFSISVSFAPPELPVYELRHSIQISLETQRSQLTYMNSGIVVNLRFLE
jgi:hypothetical protein